MNLFYKQLKSKIFFPLFTTIFSVLIFALVAEIFVRQFIDDGMQFHLEMRKYAQQVKIISPDPLIAHEHGVNRSAKLMGVDVNTNTQGLRDKEYSLNKPAGVLRILMLGDSLTFGWGVPLNDTFSKRIERLYMERGVNAEVINTGVGNWNTVQQVQYYITKGHLFNPDIVVLNYFINDAEPVPQNQNPSWIMQYCYSCVLIMGRFDTLVRLVAGGESWDSYYLNLFVGENPSGWYASKEALFRLAEFCEERGIKLLIANLPELHDVQNYRFGQVTKMVKNVAVELGIPFVDLLPSLEKFPSHQLWVTPPDPHPNSFANTHIANGIFDALLEMN